MFGLFPIEYLKTLKVGDDLFFFRALHYAKGLTRPRKIEGADWFEPGHNSTPRTFAEAAQELYRLREKYLEDFPNLIIKFHKKEGFGALSLPLQNGGVIVLGFEMRTLDREKLSLIGEQISAMQKALDKEYPPEPN